MVLLLDNFDSFTYNLYDYLMRLGVACEVLRNNTPVAAIKQKRFKGIVLSPGPGTPDRAGNMMELVDFYHTKLPILGICLGHQALGQYFGAVLHKAARPMHGKLSQITTTDDYLFKNLPQRMQVVRYHSLVLSQMPASLTTTSVTDAGEVMSFSHSNMPISGIQFHPEAAMTTYGLAILKNWASFHNIDNGNL